MKPRTKSKKENKAIFLLTILAVFSVVMALLLWNLLAKKASSDSAKTLTSDTTKNLETVSFTSIDQNVDTWKEYSTDFIVGTVYDADNTKIDITRKIVFMYPPELYLHDFSSSNSAIFLRNISDGYNHPITMQLARGVLMKGNPEGAPDAQVVPFNSNYYKIRKVISESGAAYSVNYNEKKKTSDMDFQVSFNLLLAPEEAEKEAALAIMDKIVASFRFVDDN